MIEIVVKDILGPLPGDNACYIVVMTKEKTGKIFSIQSSYADAEMCYNLLRDGLGGPNPYEFVTEVMGKLDVVLEKATLETVKTMMYGKLFYRKQKAAKPMKLVTANPAAAINSALAANVPLFMSDKAAIRDTGDEYIKLKNEVGALWPLPQLSTTESLMQLSEFIDLVQFKTCP